jgi:uncharacterized protein YbaP (TraB family)
MIVNFININPLAAFMKKSIIIFISVIALLFLVSCTGPQPVCGNGINETGEDYVTCCIDAGCDLNSSCKQNTCVKHECYEDSMCKGSEACEDFKCGEVTCSDCEFVQNHKCVKQQCCSDIDCDDKDAATEDVCLYQPKVCVNSFAKDCKNKDGYCPVFCTSENDNDCKTDRQEYRNLALGFRITYPKNWTKIEFAKYHIVIFESDSRDVIFEVQSVDLKDYNTIYDLQNYGASVISELYGDPRIDTIDEIILNGRKARKIRYKVMAIVGSYIFEDIIFLTNERGYILRSGGWAANFNLHINDFSTMVQEFEEYTSDKKMTTPFLWKISGESDTYLFGTLHTTDRRVLNLPDCVQIALNSSDAVYTEIIPSTAGTDKLVESATLKGRDTLTDILSEDLYNRTAKLLTNKGEDISYFEKSKIWVLIGALESGAVDSKDNYLILDSYLSDKAIEQNKEIASLESIEDHSKVFDVLSQDEQIQWLSDAVMQQEKENPHTNPVDEITEIYLSGNEQLLDKLTKNTETEYSKKMYKSLLTDRNKKMADRIRELITKNPKKSFFIAVGSGHLVGNDSVISLLPDLNIERVTDCQVSETKREEVNWGTLEIENSFFGITQDRDTCDYTNDTLFTTEYEICLQPIVKNLEKDEDGYNQFEMDILVYNSNHSIVYETRNIWKKEGIVKLDNNELTEDFVLISPNDFPLGNYVFEVIVYDLIAKKKGSVSIDFSLVRSKYY